MFQLTFCHITLLHTYMYICLWIGRWEGKVYIHVFPYRGLVSTNIPVKQATQVKSQDCNCIYHCALWLMIM